ncbi:Methyl-accepting chemotaxis protein 4 [Fundidesulfovibrio magnetotacticus]|uniref:histidine kinase n=1 Tax=Fundidesulfovibrio magnetotacticus TaxID=2730080 RepID=A0A6V8LL28_9BACT|nr:cache domain-containing protein [Fundidesulfovibrio magnetotacticus]GFK93402.1 Methyl-accepting chemotaxis protein 4 [Fundidesulfovibrio magnetotacticus]
MLRRFSMAARLFGLVGLFTLSTAASLAFVTAVSHRLEEVVVQHTQQIMLHGERAKIKAATHSMALTLASGLKFAKTEAERKALIREVLDPVRFEEDASGYFFVYQGTVNVALPPKPDLENQDLKDFVDADGVYYVRELSAMAHAGGGFVSYIFPRPDGPEERKVSFAEMIPGTDMWVGTGVYLGNVTREEERIGEAVRGLFNRALTVSGLGMTAIVIALALVSLAIARSVALPLAEATQAAERIASGDLDVRLAASGRDEAARLQGALNRMAGMLRENIREIQARREEAEEKAKVAEEALGQARKANQEVVAQVALRVESLQKISDSVAHQLRNPTTIIGGLAGLLLKKPALQEKYLDYLDGILDAARRIERITAAVKEYSAIHVDAVTEFPAQELLEEARRAGESAARELGVSVAWEVEPSPAALLADRDLLAMAVREVTVNAVEALVPAGGRVSLSARHGTDGFDLAVADTGRGMGPEEMEYVLDPFYSTKSVGVGMGLTKANRALQEHGGRIVIESQPGAGAVVRMILPEGGRARAHVED